MKVYIIQDDNMEVLGATLSKEVAKQMIKDCADFDNVCDYYMEECESDEWNEEDYNDCCAKAEKEIEEFAENLVNGNDTDLYTDYTRVWCTIVELSE